MNAESKRKHSRKFGGYGTFLFPELKRNGMWRLQTDFPPLLKVMKKRGWDDKSPWETIGWGTSYIFRRVFSGSYEAKRSVQRIFDKIGGPGISFGKLELGGFELFNMESPTEKKISPARGVNSPKTPPLSERNLIPDQCAFNQNGSNATSTNSNQYGDITKI